MAERASYAYQEWSKSPERQSRRVVVTAFQAETPQGNFEQSWQGTLHCKTGLSIYQMPEYDSEIQVIGQVNLSGSDIFERLDRLNVPLLYPRLSQEIRLGVIHRSVQLGLLTAAEALRENLILNEDGSINEQVDKERVGVYVGTVLAGSTDIGLDEKAVWERGRADARSIRKIDPHTLATVPSRVFGFEGPTKTIAAACSAGGHAIIAGAEDVFKGDVDIAVIIGADSFVMRPIMVKYFEALAGALSRQSDPRKALSAYSYRPTGTVASEGGATIVIETEESALRRQAKIKAEWAGYGEASDAFHPTDTSGKATRRTLEMTLKKTGVPETGYVYINGHGGGTGGDGIELEKGILPPIESRNLKKRTAVTSTKEGTGHMWGAAGVYEAEIALKSLEQNTLPPMANTEYPLRYDVNHVRHGKQEEEVSLAISTNSGLGGGTATVAFKKFK